MLKRYHLNKKFKNNGKHELHSGECPLLPDKSSLIFLGDYNSSSAALSAALAYYSNVNGCAHCASESHTG